MTADLTKGERLILKTQYAILLHVAKICSERRIPVTDDLSDLLCEISNTLPYEDHRAMLAKIAEGAPERIAAFEAKHGVAERGLVAQ